MGRVSHPDDNDFYCERTAQMRFCKTDMGLNSSQMMDDHDVGNLKSEHDYSDDDLKLCGTASVSIVKRCKRK